MFDHFHANRIMQSVLTWVVGYRYRYNGLNNVCEWMVIDIATMKIVGENVVFNLVLHAVI